MKKDYIIAWADALNVHQLEVHMNCKNAITM